MEKTDNIKNEVTLNFYDELIDIGGVAVVKKEIKEIDNEEEVSKYPIVLIERLDDAIFRRYSKPENAKRRKAECDICHKILCTKSALQNHIKAVHLKLKAFKCKHCGHKFGNEYQMQSHIRCVHNKERPFACDHCDRRFTCRVNLSIHIRYKHEDCDEEYECDICLKTFKHELKLRQHGYSQHRNGTFTCDFCGKTFTKKNSWKNHVEDLLSCILCPYETNYIKNLQKHISAIHLKLKPYDCKVCGKKFALKNNMTQHFTNVHTTLSRTHQCEMCVRAFNHAYQLKRHKNTMHFHTVHNFDKKWVCDVCNSGFASKAAMRQHILFTHLNIKNNACSFCNVAVLNKTSLKRHILRWHINRCSYSCMECNMDFTTEDEWSLHRKLAH